MQKKLSKRLADLVNALPLKPAMRVLEIGCGTGAAAREIAKRVEKGYILGIDRSEKAIQQAISGSHKEMQNGRLEFRNVAIQDFELQPEDKMFDLAIAFRVGALDGRHPEIEKEALTKISKALTKKGLLFIDGGDPLKNIHYR